MPPKTLAIQAGSIQVRLIVDGDRICGSVLGINSVHPKQPFEPASLEVWGDICRPGAVVLDIGAYTGLYSIAARLAGARAIAFEPMQFNRVRFRENAELNGVSAKVNGEAISDRCGDATITYNPIPFTSGASLVRSKGTAQKVRTVTIDSLGLKKLTAMKIDVERAEPMVLAGAQETLRRLRPALLVEVLGDDEKAAVRAAVPGYRVKRELDGRNWLMVPC